MQSVPGGTVAGNRASTAAQRIVLNNKGVNVAAWSAFAERITGRWAISWQVIVFANAMTYPQMVLTGGTLGSRQVPPEDLPTSAAVMGVTVLINAAYGTLAMFTVFRDRARTPVPLWLYAGFYLSAGVIPVLGMEYLDSVLGEQTSLPVPLRLFFACLTTLWLGVVFSLLLDSRDRFRAEREELLKEAVQLRAASLREGYAAEELRQRMGTVVEVNLSRARERIDRTLAKAKADVGFSDDDWKLVAEEFERAAGSTVRPLSHDLWLQASREYPRPRATWTVRELWRDPRFLPVVTVLITAIGLPGASVRGFGVWAPLALVVVLALEYGLLTAANQVIDRAHSARAKRATYVAGTVALAALLTAYSVLPGEVTAPIQDAGSVVIAIVTAVILISYLGALGNVRARVLESLHDEVTQAAIEAEAQRVQVEYATRELARALHGPVQSRLLACVAAIEQATAADDSEALVEALLEGASVLEYSTVMELSGTDFQPESLSQAVEAAVGNWRAVCSVSVNIDQSIEHRQDLGDVARIVEEAVANAFRHGLATSVVVRIVDEGRSISVNVRDDGSGPSGNDPGLGCQLFDRLSNGRFSLTREGDWTVLRAVVS